MKSFLYLTLILQLSFGTNVPPTVNIPGVGTIEGTHKVTFQGQTIYSFEGVPYARPPVGKYRFREPSPVKPWQGVWQAKTIYQCMQIFHYPPPENPSVIGDEDCLYLNIYSPNLDPNANLDVIVYIHGGAFMFNWGGIYQPDYLLDHNLVYLNLNYRLGPLGFLSTENEVVPGNNGLKDQLLALQWVQDNVKYFGGNPNSITIFGMSAGGASIHFHYLSPKSRGLFHRGISQSGTMLNPWVLVEKPLEKTQKLASTLGCSTKDTKQMIECLKRRPGRQIVAAVTEFQPWLYNPFSPFGVVVDSWSPDPVLPDHPYNLLKNKKVADLPWITSYTNSEGLYPASDFYSDDKYLRDIDENWNDIVPFILDYNNTVDPELRDLVSQKIRRYYLKDKQVNRESFLDFVKILTDRIFAVDIEKAILLQNAATTSPIYFYYFTYRGAHSKSEGRSGTDDDLGASHGDDTCYIFKTPVDTTSTKEDVLMVELLTEVVASFATTGRPNVPTEWPPLAKNTKNQLTYLKISSPDNLKIENLTSKGTTFWDTLPIKENEKLYPGLKDEL